MVPVIATGRRLREKGAMTRAAPSPQSDDQPARTRILAAARDAILASGVLETSMDRIAQQAGASKQTLYALFASREQLFREVLCVTMEESGEEGAPDTNTLEPAEAMRVYAQWVERSAANPANLELYRANVAAAGVFPELAADLHRLRRRATPFSAFIAGEQRGGRLPKLDADQLARWLGVLAIRGIRLLLGPAPTPAERHANLEAIIATYTHGWRTPAPGSDPRPAPALLSPPPRSTPLEQSGRISAAKWTALLRLAAGRFCDVGFRAASVEQIGAQTGIAKMSIYRRFGNKDGLFAAALDQAVDDRLAARGAMPSGDDIADTLRAIAQAHDHFTQQPDHIRLIRLLVTEAPSHADTVRRVWHRLVTPAHADLATRLDQWRAAGAVHVPDSAIGAEHFLLLAARGNRRLTDTIAWDADEAAEHARNLVALFYR